MTLVGALAGALAIIGFLGAAERGAAETLSACAGKPLCVAITDQAQATRSTSGTERFLTDTVKLYNGGTSSNLTNLTLTITWVDDGVLADSTTSAYRPLLSDSRCTLSTTSTRTITCTTPKSLGPEDFEEYQLVFRTSTLIPATETTPALPTSTTLTADATAKEQTPPKKKGTDNVAVVSQSNTTPYEGDPDLDISAAGSIAPGTADDIEVTLATSSTGGQFSTLHIPGNSPRGVYQLSEESCPTGLTCFGQHVTTVATGLSPVNLQSTYTGPRPTGLTADNLVVLHLRDGDEDPTPITDECSGTLFSGTPNPASQIPCRRVRITPLSGGNVIVEIDAWDISNGGWTFS